MQLKRIQALFDHYKKYLKRPKATENLYIWESADLFKQRWNDEALDWSLMYDQALQNSQTRRLWRREQYDPKGMMLEFIKLQPDFVQHMFQDLFNENKEIGGRVDRFVFYCDELLKAYKEANPHSIVNNHYHNDRYQIISLYLAFRYPNTYTLYFHDKFSKLLDFLGSKEPLLTADFERFTKVAKTLNTFAQKDESLLEAYRQKLQRNQFTSDDSMLLIYDIYQSI